MRNKFDKNMDIKDMRVAHELLLDGERELFLNQHYQPKKCMSKYIICYSKLNQYPLQSLRVPEDVLSSER